MMLNKKMEYKKMEYKKRYRKKNKDKQRQYYEKYRHTQKGLASRKRSVDKLKAAGYWKKYYAKKKTGDKTH